MTKQVLFYRNFQSYTGGHQKVADYFGHLEFDKSFIPYIAFSSDSVWDETNPWFSKKNLATVAFIPNYYDYVFLAGMDWARYLPLASGERPVINLIQGVRHADPALDLYGFLSEKAIRICVSNEVEDAISSTGRVNGPIYTIPNGIDFAWLNCAELKELDILILGYKQPSLAYQLKESLERSNFKIKVVDSLIQKAELIDLMKISRVFIGLPYAMEGFYLPALEAMAFCEVVVVPDCIGNRGFCINNQTCLMCDYNHDALVLAALAAMKLVKNPDEVARFQRNAKKMIDKHSIERERNMFLAIMNNIEDIWVMI
jgi:glycosyltransferase involved in cell wall biosynthesis